MTTEPRLRLSSLELRLYVVAALAGVYLISWHVVDDAPAASPAAPSTVWLDQVPIAARPKVELPAGWQLASQTPAPRLVRQPLRLRTRSS